MSIKKNRVGIGLLGGCARYIPCTIGGVFLLPVRRNNDSISGEFLQDNRGNKAAPWRSKKISAMKYANSLFRLGDEKRAYRVLECGSTLVFEVTPDGKRLAEACFCRERLCPMCAWRRSMKCFHQVSQVMDVIQAQHSDLVPIFVTFTVRNCEGDELKDTLSMIFGAWNNMVRRAAVKRVVRGWFRALEVTYNKREDTFHPHIHAIMLVHKGYFRSKDYLATEDWVQLWRSACKLNYDPVCDARKINTSPGTKKAVSEVAKYSVKDTDYLQGDDDLTDHLVWIFGNALANRRLVAFGGIMKEVSKQLKLDDAHDGDLIHVDGQEIRADVAKVIEGYRWSVGMKNYIKG